MFYLIVGKKKRREKKLKHDQDLNQGPQHWGPEEVSQQEQEEHRGQEQDCQQSNI